MQPHETCRTILSAVRVLQSEPLSQKAKDLLHTITKNANEAAEEIEYLQTAASVYRPEGTLPIEYDACGLTKRERAITLCLYTAKGCIVTRANVMAQMYANNDAWGSKSPEDVNPKITDVYLHKIRPKLKSQQDALEAKGFPSVIETVFGVGYRLVHKSKANQAHDGKYRTGPQCAK